MERGKYQGDRGACLLVHLVAVPRCRHEGKVVKYKFYTSAEGAPLRLHMRGTELFDGAHFGEEHRERVGWKGYGRLNG